MFANDAAGSNVSRSVKLNPALFKRLFLQFCTSIYGLQNVHLTLLQLASSGHWKNYSFWHLQQPIDCRLEKEDRAIRSEINVNSQSLMVTKLVFDPDLVVLLFHWQTYFKKKTCIWSRIYGFIVITILDSLILLHMVLLEQICDPQKLKRKSDFCSLEV